MNTVSYRGGAQGGTVYLPPSKSVAHRALICAALSGGKCRISPIDNSSDMQATIRFIKALGREVIYNPLEKLVEIGPGISRDNVEINCGESGSTLRFIIPVCAALGLNAFFTGEGRLPERPIGIYTDILRGVSVKGRCLPYSISGRLKSGDFSLPGNISSQFITGLLLALPLLQGDSRILLTSKLESESYVNISLSVLKDFGIEARREDYGYFVPGGQSYKPMDYRVEGDWSHAAFFLSIAAFAKKPIRLMNLRQDSLQGDKRCAQLFSEMGLKISFTQGALVAEAPENGIRAIAVNAEDIPDMVPALAVTMALARGKSEITGAARLRIKESDRLSAMAQAINTLGGNVKELADSLIIDGVQALKGGIVQGCNDHRIVMSLAAAAAVSKEPVSVTDPHSIEKSYPDFYKDYVNLGGVADVLDMG